jgi:hypothetical protein
MLLGICQPKWHNLELKMPMMVLKSYFMLILRCHPYMMESRIEVQSDELCCSKDSIQELINDRHRKFILNSGGIQFPVIHTKHPSTVLLLN